MMPLVRALLVAGASAGLAAVDGGWLPLVPGALAAILLAAGGHPRWGRWAEGGAWACAFLAVAAVGRPTLEPAPALAATALLLALAFGLHRLPPGVPRRWRAAAAAWLAAAGLALGLVAWQSRGWGAHVAGLDELTAPGLAWGALASLLGLGLAVAAWVALAARRLHKA